MCFICPPHNITPATVCTLPNVCHQQPTPATMCFICPPRTLDTLCTQLCTHIGCPPPTLTQPVVCGVVPQTVGGCLPFAPEARLETLPCPTPNSLCPTCDQGPHTPDLPRRVPGLGTITQTFHVNCLPTLTTSWFDCHTQLPGCTVHICVQGQPAAAAAAAPQPMAGGPAALAGGPAAGVQFAQLNTIATVCTQIGCQPPGCAAQTIHPTLWTLQPLCPPPTCVAHTIQPTLHTLPQICQPLTNAIFCPPHTNAVVCPPITLQNFCQVPVRTVFGCIPGTLVTQACPQTLACTPGRTGVFTPFGG